MEFRIDLHKGVSPLEFGMSSEEVQSALNLMPNRSRPPNKYGRARDDFDLVGVNYDSEGKAAEFCFSPIDDLVLNLDEHILIGPGALADPSELFYKLDPNPEERYGFLVFKAIGINTTGYHDNDKSQRAINVFRPGFWDSV